MRNTKEQTAYILRLKWQRETARAKRRKHEIEQAKREYISWLKRGEKI